MSRLRDTIINGLWKRRGWERGAILNWLALAGWGSQHEPETTPADNQTKLTAGAAETPSASSEKHPHLRIKDAPESTKVMDTEDLISEVRFIPRRISLLRVFETHIAVRTLRSHPPLVFSRPRQACVSQPTAPSAYCLDPCRGDGSSGAGAAVDG